MKKIFLLAILLIASVSSIKAQNGARGRNGQYPRGENQADRPTPTPQEIADKETERLTKMLELTPEQAAKVKALNLDYTQQRFQLAHELAQLQDRSAMETKLQGIKMAQDNALKDILTPEQQVLLAKGGRKKGKNDKKKQAKEEQPSTN